MKKINNIRLYKYVYVFIIMSILGFFYENIFEGILNLIEHGKFYYYPHRGVIYGPLNIIYGFGTVIIMLLFVNKKKNWYKIILESGLLLGIFEFLVSYIGELVTNTVSWDYSNQFLNIGGRTTIPIMIIWGLFTLLFVRIIYPFLDKILSRIPNYINRWLYIVFIIFITLDLSVTFIALYRMSARKKGNKPLTIIGKLCDEYYTDNYLNIVFPHQMFNDK